jgi:hypothetical protein
MIFFILAAICGILAILVALFWPKASRNPDVSTENGITLEELSNRLWLRRERELEEFLAKAHAPLIVLDTSPASPSPEPSETKTGLDPESKPVNREPQVAPTEQASVDREPDQSPGEQVNQQSQWKHQELVVFEEHYIKPYKNIIAQSQHSIPIKKVMEILDNYGDVPSVVDNDDDDEYKILANHYLTLKKVTLLQHSINVLQEFMKIIEESGSRDAKYSIGKYILMCLGHDLGKIRELRSGEYTTGNHPIISAGCMMGLLPPGVASKDDIITAIRNHHVRGAKNKSTMLLRQADLRAREYEAQAISVENAILIRNLLSDEPVEGQGQTKKTKAPKTYSLVDLSWVDWSEVFKRIDDEINIPNNRKWVSAYSLNDGFIYVQPLLFNTILWKLAEEKGIHEFTVYSIRDRARTDEVSVSVGQYLRENDLLSQAVHPPYVNRKFNLLDKQDNVVRSGYFIPIDAKAFPTPLEKLNERKLSFEWLMRIKTAAPC